MWTGNQQMTNQGLPEIPNTPLGVKEEGQYYFQEWRQSSRNVGGISNHIIMLKSTKLSFVLASFMLINSLRFSQGVIRKFTAVFMMQIVQTERSWYIVSVSRSGHNDIIINSFSLNFQQQLYQLRFMQPPLYSFRKWDKKSIRNIIRIVHKSCEFKRTV